MLPEIRGGMLSVPAILFSEVMQENKYTIRGTVSIFIKKYTKGTNNITLVCLFQSSRLLLSYRIDRNSLRCLKMFNGMNTLTEIAKKNRVSLNSVKEFADFLTKEGIIGLKVKGDTNNRYRRQLNFFENFETNSLKAFNFQEKLEKANVMVIGLGGIGSWVLENLVRAGIGSITVIDSDIVTLNNLSRQSFYDETDLGKTKISSTIKKAVLINHKLKIKGYRINIIKVSQLINLAKDMSLVINCADFPEVSITNNLVSKACHHLNIPHILCGGYDGHLSFLGQTVIPGKTSCWQCFIDNKIHNKALNDYKYLPITKNKEEGGTLVAIASITANVHALEAIKVISGYSKPFMTNHIAEMDFNTLHIKRTRIEKRKTCSRCNKSNEKK